jgi:hypothetical protein
MQTGTWLHGFASFFFAVEDLSFASSFFGCLRGKPFYPMALSTRTGWQLAGWEQDVLPRNFLGAVWRGQGLAGDLIKDGVH